MTTDETASSRETASSSQLFDDGSSIADQHVGQSIGPYRLLSVLGEGGFGIVWLAERREPHIQRVALKIIKPGMDSKAVIARFEQERQALAVMDHPNVAKVYDAGTTPHGRPYFVMELVQGEPITAYCDRHNLTIRQRLELFIPVCEAIQHAHTKGVIHRDIKPSNVLVITHDGKPIPKVIDFGVAKAISHTLTEKTIFTGYGQIIGTPEYMSPEQAGMGTLDIDTRTDVYSLGVLLYELLTGVLPFDARELRIKGYAEIQRIICEVDPPRPSARLSGLASFGSASTTKNTPNRNGNAITTRQATAHAIANHRQMRLDALVKELRNELEWIPLVAMRKSRSDRYATPKDLATDISNYLAGRPLSAGPEAMSYRIRKFLGRNRRLVAAVFSLVFSLVVGLIVAIALLQQVSAARLGEQEKAEQARDRLILIESFLRDIYDEMASIEGSLPARRMMLEETKDFLAKLTASNDEMTVDDQRLAAVVQMRIGQLRKRGDSENEQALREISGACSQLNELASQHPEDRLVAQQYAWCVYELAMVCVSRFELDTARKQFEQVIDMATQLSTDKDYFWDAIRLQGLALEGAGSTLYLQALVTKDGNRAALFDSAVARFEESLAVKQRILDAAVEEPEHSKAGHDLAVSTWTLSRILVEADRRSDARRLLESVVERELGESSNSARPKRDDLLQAHFRLGEFLLNSDQKEDWEAARNLLITALNVSRRIQLDDPRDFDVARDVSRARALYGTVLIKLGESDYGCKQLRLAIDEMEEFSTERSEIGEYVQRAARECD